jgi:hypothetical protein
MGLKWLIFLIGPLDLISMLFGEYQKGSIPKTHDQKRLDYVFTYQWLLYTQWWTYLGGLIYLVKKSTNMHFWYPN